MVKSERPEEQRAEETWGTLDAGMRCTEARITFLEADSWPRLHGSWPWEHGTLQVQSTEPEELLRLRRENAALRAEVARFRKLAQQLLMPQNVTESASSEVTVEPEPASVTE